MADYNVDIALKVKGQKQLKDILKPLNEIVEAHNLTLLYLHLEFLGTLLETIDNQ